MNQWRPILEIIWTISHSNMTLSNARDWTLSKEVGMEEIRGKNKI
jgi:hypothetical protein